jgi:DNA-binding NtrC family response regulator
VRELRFAVERTALLAEGDVIEAGGLLPEITGAGGRAAPAEPASADSARPGRAPDAARVRAALEQARWRREKAAEILGVSPRTLFRWMRVWAFEQPREVRLAKHREAQRGVQHFARPQLRSKAQQLSTTLGT